MKKQGLFLLTLHFCVSIAFAQIETTKRIEFELKEGYDNHDIAVFGDNGILFYSKSTDKKGKNANWKIEQYSTDLELKNTEIIEFPENQFLNETYTTETDLYLFFTSKKNDYSLFRINAKTLKIDKIKGALPDKADIFEIHVIDDMVYFDAKIKKAPMLFTLNVKSGEQGLVPITLSGYDIKNLGIEDVQVIEKSKEVLVYINAFKKKDHNMYVIRFDKEGNKQSTFNLTKGHTKKLSSISASYIGKNKYIYTGTYSEKSASTAQGVYLCSSNNDEVVFFKFYNFLDFDKFLSYLPEKKQEKIEKKKAKQESKGKELEIDYLMATHNIIDIDGKFVFLGEAFYATYRTETYTTYVNGKPVTRTRRVFDGYQYTHSVVAGFDKDGEKLWDNTFEMWPSYKPYFKKKFITTSIDGDRKLNLMFSSVDKIKTMSFYSNGEVSKAESFAYIETTDEADKVKRSYSNMDHWYDRYFIAHGEQTIINKEEKAGHKKRKVYFINKISYK